MPQLPASGHDGAHHVHLIAGQDFAPKLKSPNCLEILPVSDPGVDTGSRPSLLFTSREGLKEYENPLKEYKQCCLRTFIVKVLNEALKIDKEFKHGIGTNDVTMTVVHYRVSVWKSVDGTWECCRVRNSMKWRTTIPYSDNSPSPLG